MDEFDLELLALTAAAKKKKAAQSIDSMGFPQAPTGHTTTPGALDGLKQDLTGVGMGAVNGASFGMSENAIGAMGALSQARRGPGAMVDTYTGVRDAVRGAHDSAEAAAPNYYKGGEVLGATGMAAASAPYAAGSGLLGTMGRGLAIGAGEGALHGVGDALSPLEGLRKGAIGGAIGAGAGLLAPAATALARTGGRALSDTVGGGIGKALGKGSQTRANRAIAATMGRSGKSVNDVADAMAQASRDGQSMFVPMDAMGKAGQRRANAITRSGGDGSEEITQFLNQRQLDQPERVAGFIEDDFGFRGGPAGPTGTAVVPEGHTFIESPAEVLARQQRSAQGLAGDLKTARGNASDIAYPAAREGAGPVDVRDALGVIDARIGPMEGANIAGDGIDAKLAGFRKRLAADPAPNGEISRELSDFDRVLGVKQDIQDARGAAIRAGRDNEARNLKELEKSLDAALEDASDGYRKANDDHAYASRVIDAVDDGAAMARPGMRATDTTTQFQSMGPDQKSAARVGYGDKLLAKIEAAAGETTNRARPLTSTKARKEAQALALDPERFKRRVDREMTMHETQNTALGGSKTADNQADAADLAPYDTNMLVNASTGQWGSAARQLLQSSANVVTGMNPKTREMIAEALMSGNTTALQKAVTQIKGKDRRKTVMDALLRSMNRESGMYPALDQ